MLKRIRALLGGRSKPGDGSAETPPVHRGPQVVHRPIAEGDLDPDAVKIVQRLTRFDHTAYLVGGCVRDLLLERKPKDFDIGTSATPRQIKRLFRNCRIIGRRFRLAHIYFQNSKIIEVATFRARDESPPADGEDGDLLIRDDNVFGTPEQDALRRDFTINQLFYDLTDETVLDHAQGLDDLRRRLVRTIGDPEIRFREDPIRSLRAIKFAARLDFEIERESLKALCATRNELERAAPPRILEEINRFCRSGAARRSFELLKETEVLGVILPEIDAGCSAHPEAWSLLLDLLREMDTVRVGQRREIRLGETFAVLALPALLDRIGWLPGGTPQGMRVAEARARVDEVLRPLAMRLRIPRREQEYCRQTLMTLSRMVPARNLRRSTKRSIVGRPCFEDTLWILAVIAPRLKGEFIDALDSWRSSRESLPPLETKADDEATDEEGESRPAGRRRRSRGGRRRRPRGDRPPRSDADSAAPKAAAPPAKRDDMPPVWDENYFFAALPDAPDAPDTADTADTAVKPALAAAEPTAASPAAPDENGSAPPSEDAPRRRRRRRRGGRRRRKSGTPSGETAAEDTPAEPSGDGS